jgi:hypothetical protein
MPLPDAKGRIWLYASLTCFCGLPLLLIVLIGTNLRATTTARDLAAQQQASLSQIVTGLAGRRGLAMTPEDVASLYLASVTGSLATAELQEYVTKLVDGAGGHLTEARLIGTPEQEADGIVAVQISLNIDNKGLLNLLYGLEAGLPLMVVSDLNVSTANRPRSDSSNYGSPLNVEITVQSHFRKKAG